MTVTSESPIGPHFSGVFAILPAGMIRGPDSHGACGVRKHGSSAEFVGGFTSDMQQRSTGASSLSPCKLNREEAPVLRFSALKRRRVTWGVEACYAERYAATSRNPPTDSPEEPKKGDAALFPFRRPRGFAKKSCVPFFLPPPQREP